MKIWPFITLGVLLYGSTFSDGQNVGRESHPHAHRSALDDIMKAMPHRVATFAVPAMFRIENIIGDGQDWTKPEGKATSQTGDTEDPDAGEDPGKKLFWTHKIPGVYDPAPFPGWGYSEPDRSPLSAPACGECRPGNNLTITYTYTDNESERSTRTETMAISQPTFLDAATLKFVSDAIGGAADKVIDTITVDPATGQKHHHFHHRHEPVVSDPLDPTDPIIGPADPPIVAFPVGGGGVGAISATVPEPSTWTLLGLGFAALALASATKRRASRFNVIGGGPSLKRGGPFFAS